MSVKNSLTNEKLNDRFENAFSLVNHAIQMARHLVRRGEEFYSNPASEVLERIIDGEDVDDELDDEDNDDDTLENE